MNAVKAKAMAGVRAIGSGFTNSHGLGVTAFICVYLRIQSRNVLSHAVSETLFAANAWIKGIGIATNYYRVKNIPDRGTV